MKRSFSSKEAATTAGIAIKKAYPVVVVTVFNSQEHTTELISFRRVTSLIARVSIFARIVVR
jgi:hypothetical protein